MKELTPSIPSSPTGLSQAITMRCTKFLSAGLLSFVTSFTAWCNPSPSFATGVLTPAATAPSLLVQDIDGSPKANVNTLKFTNGTVADNGDGTATVTTDATIVAQLSSSVSQLPSDTLAHVITYDTQDLVMGIAHTIGGSKVTVPSDGVYVIVLGGQISRTGGGGVQSEDIWLRKNGVDVPNSGIRQTLLNPNDTSVVVNNFALSLLANDYIEVMQRVTSAAIGMGITRLDVSGGPSIPSIIFTMVKI